MTMKVPGPETPQTGTLLTNATLVDKKWYSNKPTMNSPDWNFWRAMRKVLYWQACALSVGADPDTMGRRQHDSYWNYDAYHADQLPATHAEIMKKRLRLLKANCYDREVFTQSSTLNTGEVLLSEFAAWGLSLGWDDMPQELAAMAQEKAVIAPVAGPRPQLATQERFASLRSRELWSEGELHSIMCGDAGRLFGSGPSASDIERKDAHGAILDGIGVESLIVNDWRQVESTEWMESPATVRYFKPEQAIAWVNRDRFPKFPFHVSEVMPPVSKLQAAPASEPVMPTALPVLRQQEAEQSTTHKIINREAAILNTEIAQAKAKAPDPEATASVWGELTKLAESKFGVMIGFSSDGIQYRGKKYQATQEPDVFTLNNLRDRMYRALAKARKGAQRRA